MPISVEESLERREGLRWHRYVSAGKLIHGALAHKDFVGVLALWVALAPDEWFPHADTGLLIMPIVFRFLSPIAFQRVELVYSLCPA